MSAASSGRSPMTTAMRFLVLVGRGNVRDRCQEALVVEPPHPPPAQDTPMPSEGSRPRAEAPGELDGRARGASRCRQARPPAASATRPRRPRHRRTLPWPMTRTPRGPFLTGPRSRPRVAGSGGSGEELSAKRSGDVPGSPPRSRREPVSVLNRVVGAVPGFGAAWSGLEIGACPRDLAIGFPRTGSQDERERVQRSGDHGRRHHSREHPGVRAAILQDT